MLLICPFSNLLQLIWMQFYYLNPSVFCMMNRFYLLVMISFWNKYINTKWVQKAVLWHLEHSSHNQSLYCSDLQVNFSPFFFVMTVFCLVSFIVLVWLVPSWLLWVFFVYFFFCVPQAVSASLGVANMFSLDIQPCISATTVIFPSGKMSLRWHHIYQPVSPSPPTPLSALVLPALCHRSPLSPW